LFNANKLNKTHIYKLFNNTFNFSRIKPSSSSVYFLLFIDKRVLNSDWQILAVTEMQ